MATGCQEQNEQGDGGGDIGEVVGRSGKQIMQGSVGERENFRFYFE